MQNKHQRQRNRLTHLDCLISSLSAKGDIHLLPHIGGGEDKAYPLTERSWEEVENEGC